MKNAIALVDAMPLPVILIDPNGRLEHSNKSALNILGGAVTGRSYVGALRQPVLLDCVETAMRLGKSNTTEWVSTFAGRETLWRVSVEPVKFQSDPSYYLVTFEDRTAMREARQIRRDFVANVSHELRTPLTSLIGFIETLKGPARNDPEGRAKFLSTMEREANRMNRLIGDLLSLSKVEGTERIRPREVVDLAGVINMVASALKPLVQETGCDLEVIGTGAAREVPGDADQLAQVFTNLIENAIKYGGGEVRVQLTEEASEAGMLGPVLKLVVRDNGEGFDPVHIPRLTERFYRIDSHRSREKGGTGLGLAIVKHIINRHRGRLRIQSAPGVGSEFTVILQGVADTN